MNQKKQLTIFQENNVPIIMIDEDERSLSEYAKELSSFMSLNNISILETTKSTAIIRPSKISSILIDNINISEYEEDKKPQIKTSGRKEPIKKKKQKKVDIITDVD